MGKGRDRRKRAKAKKLSPEQRPEKPFHHLLVLHREVDAKAEEVFVLSPERAQQIREEWAHEEWESDT